MRYVEMNIEDLEPGARIVGYDTETGEFVETTYRENFVAHNCPTIKIHLENGTVLHTTGDHGFLTRSGDYKVKDIELFNLNHPKSDPVTEAQSGRREINLEEELQLFEELKTIDGYSKIVQFEDCDNETVYHLMGSGTKNFITHNIVAHNLNVKDAN